MSQSLSPVLAWRSGQTRYGDVILGEGSLILCAVEHGNASIAQVSPHWKGGWTSTVNTHKLLGPRPWAIAPSRRLAQAWASRWTIANWKRLEEEIVGAPETIGRPRAVSGKPPDSRASPGAGE